MPTPKQIRALVQRKPKVVAFTKSQIRGDCFGYACTHAQKIGGEVVHGEVTHPWDKTKFKHAWVEHEGKVYDWQTEHLKRPQLSVEQFHAQWKPASTRRYTSADAMKRATKSKHFGPWGD